MYNFVYTILDNYFPREGTYLGLTVMARAINRMYVRSSCWGSWINELRSSEMEPTDKMFVPR